MIRHVHPLHLRAIGAISPSSAATMKVCRLRLQLGLNTVRAEEGPPATAAVIGIVAHEMMAQIRRGALADVPDREIERWLSDEWMRRISTGYAVMREQAIAGNVPPPIRWRNYFMTRARLLRVLAIQARAWRPPTVPGHGTATEKWLESPDGILCGRLDRVERDPDGVHIVDLKTSQSHSPEMRPEHREQLLIYAALWQRCKGEWPVRASIEYLGLGRRTIEVDPAEAEAVVTDLTRRRDELNRQVFANVSPADLASPSAEVCQHCDGRGVCLPFLHTVSEDWGWYRRVVAGRVDEVAEEDGDHNLKILVSAGNLPADIESVRVKGFHRDVAPDIGAWVTVVDAQFTVAPNVLQANWDTQLWVWPSRPHGL